MPIFLKTEDEIDQMRIVNRLVGHTLSHLGKHIKPGVTTLQLDKVAQEFIHDYGAVPAISLTPNPFGEPFPASITTSLNGVGFGFPNDKDVLYDGDVISVECGALLNGFYGLSCYTFSVGQVCESVLRLLQVTRKALDFGIEQSIAGNHVGDISFAIQSCCKDNGFSVVKDYEGHGIGKSLHESPSVPNFGKLGSGVMLKSGMCLTLSPTFSLGCSYKKSLPRFKWDRASDHQPVARFEQTLVVRKGKAEILSSFAEVEHLERQNF